MYFILFRYNYILIYHFIKYYCLEQIFEEFKFNLNLARQFMKIRKILE